MLKENELRKEEEIEERKYNCISLFGLTRVSPKTFRFVHTQKKRFQLVLSYLQFVSFASYVILLHD